MPGVTRQINPLPDFILILSPCPCLLLAASPTFASFFLSIPNTQGEENEGTGANSGFSYRYSSKAERPKRRDIVSSFSSH